MIFDLLEEAVAYADAAAAALPTRDGDVTQLWDTPTQTEDGKWVVADYSHDLGQNQPSGPD